MADILIVDDDPSLQRVLAAAVRDAGHTARVAGSVAEGETEYARATPDLLLLDLNLPDGSGLDWLDRLEPTATPVIVITAQNTVDNAIRAIQSGAFDYLTKPFDLDDFDRLIDAALKSREEVEPHQQSGAADAGPRLIGTSRQMQEVYKTIGRAAGSDATVLITGESGTGKELVARALHEFSPRRSQPFVAVNTAAIPADLLEAELFGYERGAFTGATSASPGKFREADGGTILLDEIGDMPLALQGKLLRVLQEREITPLGGRQAVRIDVRVIAATQVRLEEAVASGAFRADLFYRLNIVQIDLPPLRERIDDIPELAEHFLAQMVNRAEIPPKSIAEDALILLRQYPWPGNVRQLENVIRRVALLSPGRIIDAAALARHSGEFGDIDTLAATTSFADHIDGFLRTYVSAMHDSGDGHVWGEVMATVEDVLLRLALEQTAGNQVRAATLLGINRNTIRKKLEEHGIDPREYRSSAQRK
ncbi:MAG: sigma-54-dependent Fis family transcriptional regulator [Candidatus Dadabacteria bacterium]|nr:MAG: sigma-54-dependent Fis family transcriptional regulator [Candidatus Dadabacteria bacterium]